MGRSRLFPESSHSPQYYTPQPTWQIFQSSSLIRELYWGRFVCWARAGRVNKSSSVEVGCNEIGVEDWLRLDWQRFGEPASIQLEPHLNSCQKYYGWLSWPPGQRRFCVGETRKLDFNPRTTRAHTDDQVVLLRMRIQTQCSPKNNRGQQVVKRWRDNICTQNSKSN